MTQDDIIRMAREAGMTVFVIESLERFAALVAAHEREKLAEQEPVDMEDHPPHRLCECRKCMEYFTPLPDCDAFAASGKPIAEQTNTQLMEGFRPVSEMIAEHKQDPKKAAAIEKAKMRKATRAEKIVRPGMYEVPAEQAEQEPVGVVETSNEWGVAGVVVAGTPVGTLLYAAPVRTKDLTDDEIDEIWTQTPWSEVFHFARAVIAADREKNK